MAGVIEPAMRKPDGHPRRLDPKSGDLIVACYPLVQRIARRIRSRLPQGIALDELVSTGVIGLIEAVERYDPARGIPFEAFAKHRIQGAILDSLRASDWISRSARQRVAQVEDARRALAIDLRRPPTAAEVAAQLGTTVAFVLAAADDAGAQGPVSFETPSAEGEVAPIDVAAGGVDPEEDFADHEQRARTAAAREALPERERTAIEMFYFQDRSLKEIGAVLGVSESRVSQLCAQGIRRMRTALQPEETPR
jgi:RNA polymerase sigma factor for flagellar operon FliA